MLGSLGTLLLVSAVGANSNAHGYYYLEGGGYVAGTVVMDNGSGLSIRVRDTNETKRFVYADFTPRTQYKLRALAISPEEGPEHIELGDFSLELGLHREAARHFRQAARLSPLVLQAASDGLHRVEILKAQSSLDSASRFLETGQLMAAQELLVTLSEHEESSIAARAIALMDSFPAVTRSKPYFVEEAYPAFARVRKYLERAKEKNRDGLLHTRSSSRAQRDFRSAAKDIRRALKLLDKIRASDGKERVFEHAVADMEQSLLDLYATTALNRCSLHMIQQSFRQALTALNEALAFDQTNALLLEARTRVEEAVSNSSGSVVLGPL